MHDAASLDEAVQRAYRLSDFASARAGARQFDAVVRSESVANLLNVLSAAQLDDPGAVARLFVNSPRFITELGLLVNEHDQATDVIRVAVELMTKRSEEVERYPALAAAICVVHDQPTGEMYTVRINENETRGLEPLVIFDFFVANAATMHFSPDRLPAIDLVFVVDVSDPIRQLQWAHDTFSANPGVGQRFFEIEYDYDHYRSGKPKKVTKAGSYSIWQIKKHGGVCADQAHYAMTVAKACGVPSGYVVAKGADVSHAWVGYLRSEGRGASWDFDAGRYMAYQHLRGNFRDPQSGERYSDGRVGILGKAVGVRNELVHHSMAAGLVVRRMNSGLWDPPEEMDLDARGNLRKPRTGSVKDRLALLRMTLDKCAGVASTWDMVREIAESGEMSRNELDTWSRAVLRLAGSEHLDFSFDFLADLISTVDDANEQHEMWEWTFKQFRARPDLAAAVRFEQGKLWDANDKPELAWIAYQDVLDKFLNDGPMCDSALSAMGKLLSKNGKRDAYLELLRDTAIKVDVPNTMASQFAKQSNYYKVHWRLVKELEYHNRDAEAAQIRELIHMPASD